MLRTFNLLNQNCRTAARLVSESHDRPLDRLEKTGLTIHLLGCRNCRRYRDQIRMVEDLAKGAEEAENVNKLSTEARQRIALQLSSTD